MLPEIENISGSGLLLIGGNDINPQIKLIQHRYHFIQLRGFANHFDFLRVYQIAHFHLACQHVVQICTADIE